MFVLQRMQKEEEKGKHEGNLRLWEEESEEKSRDTGGEIKYWRRWSKTRQ